MRSGTGNKTITSTETSASARRPLRLSFSLGSMLVIMTVVAFLGTVLAQLTRSIMDPTPANVGYFALAAAVGPSAILIIVGTVFKCLGWMKKQQSKQVARLDR